MNGYPVGPLLDYLERRYGPLLCRTGRADDIADLDLGPILGVTPATFGKWRRNGTIPERSGDRVAVLLVGHPSILWPAEYSALELPDRPRDKRTTPAR